MGRNHRYSSLSTDENHAGITPLGLSKRLRTWKITVLVLAILNVLLVSHAVYKNWWPRQELPFSPLAGTSSRYHAYGHFTNFSSPTGEDTEQIQALWDEIEGGHGIVAVDKKWARDRHLAPALSLPTDPTRGVYAIDGYHQMHCLKLLRESFYKLYRKDPNPFAKSFDHYSHCFDYLRQSVMCSASDHLFATVYGGLTGDNELRRCRDWSKLRDFATEHSACDKNDFHHRNDFLGPNLCHGPNDGLPEPIDGAILR